MKIGMLITAFALIICTGVLFTTGPLFPSIQEYKPYFWIPIPIGISLLIFTLLQKDATDQKK